MIEAIMKIHTTSSSVTFECGNAAIIGYDKDRFIATIKVNLSGTFYGWVFKFMGKIKILSPKSV